MYYLDTYLTKHIHTRLEIAIIQFSKNMFSRRKSPTKNWYAHKSVTIASTDQFNSFIGGDYSNYGLKAGSKNLGGMLPTYYYHCKKCTGLLGTYKLIKDCIRGG